MSEPEDTIVVSPEVLHAQLCAAAVVTDLPVAVPITSDSDEALNAPVKRRAIYTGPDRKASLAAALEETRAQAARTEDEDALYQAFRSAARELKAAEAAFKAASKAYAEAVGKLSDAVAK